MTEQPDTIIEELTSINKSVKEIEAKGKFNSLIEQNDFFIFFNTLSTISVIFIVAFAFNINKPDSLYRDILFWGSLFSKLVLYILIINYIYRFKFITYFYELKFTKVITTFIFSIILLFCNSKASAVINDLFGISANDLPYSLTFTTTFYLVNYLSNTLLLIGIICLIGLVIICVIEALNDKDATPNQNWWTIIVLLVFAFTTFSMQNKEISEISIRQKAYWLALQMDFNQNYYCKNIKKDYKVAFIGSNQEKVIVNKNTFLPESIKFEDFLIRTPSSYSIDFPVKTYFPVVTCKVLDIDI
ncbi:MULTISPECIES: hypothetical protein [Acinetobacter calcoaceticus/baumannii complex]|nr:MULTISPECIES: hypothetical protein [Acinetobacter calcoaceticus/baumannii complex]SSR41149.1 Uncharacterised protein [Acinetobacter baumannii]EXR34303.1 putative membrane protein [Acinetobacter sp. 1179249]MBP1497022.1 hypothetical protein [Acinetobacter nosocomialis]MBR7689998.1 hypothetical protein [Acinetobacter nosocomialis]MBR7730004.1 hypothetical protein [Acinetobacter nosocomialis]